MIIKISCIEVNSVLKIMNKWDLGLRKKIRGYGRGKKRAGYKVRRTDIFHLRMKGLSVVEIAKILNVHPSTVYRHLRVIARKWYKDRHGWFVLSGFKRKLLRRKRKYNFSKELIMKVLYESSSIDEVSKKLRISKWNAYYVLKRYFSEIYEEWKKRKRKKIKNLENI